MKVTKSLLLGAAAGFVAMSGAQAADLPVKAKPVEYVKICSAYGAGFYYIPGTDICLRVGGYVFVETGVKGRNAAVGILGLGNQFTTDDNYNEWRARGHVILDARNNTAYGTLRAYFVGGVSYRNERPSPAGSIGRRAATGASMDRAFIQFAGFTAGFTESFFSFGGAYSIVASSSLAWDWLPLIAYTAQLGNGVSATFSVEDGTARPIGGADGFCWVIPTFVRTVVVSAPTSTAVTMLLTSSRTFASPRLGARRRSWARCTKCGLRTSSRVVHRAASGVARSVAASKSRSPQTGNPNNSFLFQGTWTEGSIEFTGLGIPLGNHGERRWLEHRHTYGLRYLSDGYVPGCTTVAGGHSTINRVAGELHSPQRGRRMLPIVTTGRRYCVPASRLATPRWIFRARLSSVAPRHPGCRHARPRTVAGHRQHDLVAGGGPRSQPRHRLLEGEEQVRECVCSEYLGLLHLRRRTGLRYGRGVQRYRTRWERGHLDRVDPSPPELLIRYG